MTIRLLSSVVKMNFKKWVSENKSKRFLTDIKPIKLNYILKETIKMTAILGKTYQETFVCGPIWYLHDTLPLFTKSGFD